MNFFTPSQGAETTRSLTLAAQIPQDRCSPLLFVIGCAAAHDGLFLFELKKEKIGPLVGTGGLLPTLDGGMVSAPGWAFWAPDLGAQQRDPHLKSYTKL